MINFHGGGFVLGNLTAADWLCGQLAGRAGVAVVSVAYRLAPEHPAPMPVPGRLDRDPLAGRARRTARLPTRCA